jgi:hypothetical protein
MMVNDSESIASVDKSNMLGGLARFPEQIKESLTIAEAAERFSILKIDNVVIAGMGASAISGDIMASLFRDKLDVPLVVNREAVRPPARLPCGFPRDATGTLASARSPAR